MDEWFDLTWRKPEAIAVKPYKMDARIGYKSFDMTLEDGKKVTFYRIQEHPELKLYDIKIIRVRGLSVHPHLLTD